MAPDRCGLLLLAVVALGGGCSEAMSPASASSPKDAGADSNGCVSQHPRGSAAIASADMLATVLADCRKDDGECLASTPCTGSVANRICEDSSFITPEAALCIAMSAGLERGLDAPTVTLVYNYAYRRVIWSVMNVLYDGTRVLPPGAPGSKNSSGFWFSVDAVTGEGQGPGQWTAVGD